MTSKKIVALIAVLLLMLVSIAFAQEIDYCEGNFDFDQDQDGTDAFKFKTDFGRSALKNPCPPDGPAPAQKTGQTTCYDTAGNARECTGTGEDGEYQKGIVSPDPRFTDYGDGTVTDNLTGLMWTKDAQIIPGSMTWQAALNACNDLVYGGHDDWRLPNVKEMQSLIDYSQVNPALPSGYPFINVQDNYWSSNTYPYMTYLAMIVYVFNGYMRYDNKGFSGYEVWPVRGGQ